MCKITEKYDCKRIEMDSYVIVKSVNQSSVINGDMIQFGYDELASCSAIIFICEEGLAGFHYGAQSLALDDNESDKDKREKKRNEVEQYKIEMNAMISRIISQIGSISKIYCFTPRSNDSYNACYDRYIDNDIDALESFFQENNLSFCFSNNLGELLSINDKIIPWYNSKRKTYLIG